MRHAKRLMALIAAVGIAAIVGLSIRWMAMPAGTMVIDPPPEQTVLVGR